MFEQRVNSDVLTVSTVNSQDQVTQKPLRDSVKQALKNYFAQLNGQLNEGTAPVGCDTPV